MTTFFMSSTSTQVIEEPVTAKIAGVLFDVTGTDLDAALIEQSVVDSGVQRAPVTADYVQMTWTTDPNGRGLALVLVGPAADLAIEAPSSTMTERMYQVWLRIRYGDEDVRFHAFDLGVQP